MHAFATKMVMSHMCDLFINIHDYFYLSTYEMDLSFSMHDTILLQQ